MWEGVLVSVRACDFLRECDFFGGFDYRCECRSEYGCA